jgi:hypothetical protein
MMYTVAMAVPKKIGKKGDSVYETHNSGFYGSGADGGNADGFSIPRSRRPAGE